MTITTTIDVTANDRDNSDDSLRDQEVIVSEQPPAALESRDPPIAEDLGEARLAFLFAYGSFPKSGQRENTENVTLQKRPITFSIPSFWWSHAVC